MPDFNITGPDGKDYTISGPEGSTREDALRMAPKLHAAGKLRPAEPKEAEKPKDISWSDVPLEAVKHVPESAVNFAKATIEPVLHPIETATNLKNIGAGVLQKLNLLEGKDAEPYADAVGQFLKARYGSTDAIKQTLANDPVGLAADLSMVFSLGGSAAARAPGMLGRAGEAVAATGKAIDPLQAAASGAKLGAKQVQNYAGNYLAHVGERPLAEAFKAGAAGGARADAFQGSLRGVTPVEEIVGEARGAVEGIGQEAGKAYRSGMLDISQDYHMLDFADINAAMKKNEGVGRYKGVELETPDVKSVRERMSAVINTWRGYAPAQYHTPEGFDALKRALGYIYEETERGTPANLVAGAIYRAAKDTIVKQAPAYAKVMEGYAESKNIIRELEHELTGKPDALVNPALRKLQSVMRNNVHTNWGSREKLAEMLVENGATNLMERLAGQALRSWTPRGFGKLVGSADLAAGIGGALLGHPWVLAKVLLTLPMMSPRILGEAAYYAGKMSPLTPGRVTGDVLFQAGRADEAVEKVGAQ